MTDTAHNAAGPHNEDALNRLAGQVKAARDRVAQTFSGVDDMESAKKAAAQLGADIEALARQFASRVQDHRSGAALVTEQDGSTLESLRDAAQSLVREGEQALAQLKEKGADFAEQASQDERLADLRRRVEAILGGDRTEDRSGRPGTPDIIDGEVLDERQSDAR